MGTTLALREPFVSEASAFSLLAACPIPPVHMVPVNPPPSATVPCLLSDKSSCFWIIHLLCVFSKVTCFSPGTFERLVITIPLIILSSALRVRNDLTIIRGASVQVSARKSRISSVSYYFGRVYCAVSSLSAGRFKRGLTVANIYQRGCRSTAVSLPFLCQPKHFVANAEPWDIRKDCSIGHKSSRNPWVGLLIILLLGNAGGHVVGIRHGRDGIDNAQRCVHYARPRRTGGYSPILLAAHGVGIKHSIMMGFA